MGDPVDASRARAAQLARHVEATQQITHIGSWQWDLATNAVSWSDELYRIYGLEPGSREITLDVFLRFLHPDDRARIQGEVAAAVQRGGRFAYLERIVRGDGSQRDLDTVGEAIVDEQGRVVGLIGTCRDITEERRREETIRLFVDIVQNVEIGLSVWSAGASDDARAATLVMSNPAADRVLGASLGASIGRPLVEILPALEPATLRAIAEIAQGAPMRELSALEIAGREGARRSVSVRAFPLPGRSVGLALEDVTAATRARRLHTAEHKILEMIAAGAPLQEILDTLVRVIEDLAPPTIGSVLLLDPQEARLRHGSAPGLPDAYNRAIDGAPIGPAAGSCGTSAYLRRAVVVVDVETDPLWADYRDLARLAGIRACWSTPIFSSGGRVGGTFALYWREPRTPSEEELDLIARATHLAGIAIQRKDLDDQHRALSAHIEAAREDERTAVSREIHDELGQALTALKMDLAWIGRRTKAPENDAIREKLAAMSTMTDGIIDTVRRISAELRPGVLDDLGLVDAIEWQAEQFEERTGVTCVVRTDVGDTRFDRNVATALFRILQEALTNVTRHADAARVEVSLAREDRSIRLEVRDDGKGIDPEAIASPTSLGLLGMRERARRLGGTVTIAGAPGQGTRFVVEVPLAGSAPR